MTDPAAVAAYRTAFARRARPVTVQRIAGLAPNATIAASADVTAVVTNYAPEAGENYSGPGEIPRGLRKVMLLADDLARAGFPLPLRDNDTIILAGSGDKLTLLDVDAETRALAGAIECQASGL